MRNEQPNIIFVTLHDLGKHLHCYDPDLPETPNIERIAQEGVVFENHFSTCPLCSPARSSIQTGRYPHSNGMNGLTHRGFGLNDDEKCLPQYLNELGYHTALFGLQHEVYEDIGRLGYQEVRQTEDGKSFVPDVIPAAVDFLRRKHEKPFLLSVGFFDVHLPFKQPYSTPIDPATVKVPPYLMDCAAVREDMADFYGLIQAVDRGMGQFLDALDESGLSENTLLLFTTDHGAAFPRSKSTLYDPGIGVSLLARRPGHIKPGTRIRGMTSHVDILPTVFEILGQPVPECVPGESILTLIENPGAQGRKCVFAEKSWHGNEYDPMRCIRTERFKYIHNFTAGWLYQTPLDIKMSLSGKVMEASRQKPRPMTELYDLKRDPNEFNNLSGKPEYEEIEADLNARLETWMEETGDLLPDQHIPWPQPGKEHYLNNKACPMPDETGALPCSG